jgi:molecular chaperone GrpE
MTQDQARQQNDEMDPEEEGAAEGQPAPEAEEVADQQEEDRLSDVEAELAETKDRMLRAMADVENTRRRAAREQEEARKYAMTGFARELLEVADNLARALDSVPDDVRESDQVKPLVEGIELTQKSLANCFERHKITKVSPEAGERFDHNHHQAMFEVETTDHEPGAVVQVMQAGYVIADRLLRPALVGVAKKPAAAQPPASEASDDQRGQTLDTNA